MKTDEKIKLAKLLGEYMAEKADGNLKRTERDRYNLNCTKSLYTHARILYSKLTVEIDGELKKNWEA